MEKKVFLEDLPRTKRGIDWLSSVGSEIKFIYDDILGTMKIKEYNKDTKYLTLLYKNKEYEIYRGHFMKCAIGRIVGRITPDFKYEIGEQIKDKNRNITIKDKCIKNNQKYYLYYCNVDGNEDWILENHLVKGVNCNVCTNQKVMVGVNDIPTTAPWLTDYFQGGYDEAKNYTRSSTKKIFPKCPKCGTLSKQATVIGNIYKMKGIKCRCEDKMSKPNKFIRFFIEEVSKYNNISNVEFEYSPKWISPLRYDCYFILDGKEYIIEMDGGFGHGNNKVHPKSTISGEELVKRDRLKDVKAFNNGIKVIRIDCNYESQDAFEFIKNNIINNNDINKMFCMNEIDWTFINTNIQSNMCKIICDIKNKYPVLTSTDIAKIVNMDRTNVTKNLKKGSLFGWCNYEVEKEKHLGKGRTKEMKKQIEMMISEIKQEIYDTKQ